MAIEPLVSALFGGEFGFLRPWALVVAPAPFAARLLLPPSPAGGALPAPPGIARWLSASGGGAGRGRTGSAPALAAAGWLMLLVALAGPHFRGPELTVPTGRDMILALDISASMAERDMAGPEGPVARIDAVRAAARDLLAGREGDRAALIGFATEAYLITPLTHDLAAAAAMLDEMAVGMPGRRTDLGQAIGLAVRVLRDAPEGERLLVLLTDGEANAGDLAAMDAAALAAGAGIRLHLIGFAAGLEPDRRAELVAVAARAGGRFHEAANPEALRRVAAAVAALEPVTPPAARPRLVEDRTSLFVAAALIIAGLAIWRERRG